MNTLRLRSLVAALTLVVGLSTITACSKSEDKPVEPVPAAPPAEPAPAPAPAAPAPVAAADIKAENADAVAADLEKEIAGDSADEDKQ